MNGNGLLMPKEIVLVFNVTNFEEHKMKNKESFVARINAKNKFSKLITLHPFHWERAVLSNKLGEFTRGLDDFICLLQEEFITTSGKRYLRKNKIRMSFIKYIGSVEAEKQFFTNMVQGVHYHFLLDIEDLKYEMKNCSSFVKKKYRGVILDDDLLREIVLNIWKKRFRGSLYSTLAGINDDWFKNITIDGTEPIDYVLKDVEKNNNETFSGNFIDWDYYLKKVS